MAVAIESTQEQLERVQEVIRQLESGQLSSYTLPNGQSFTRHNLATLYAREQQLLDRLRRETGAGFAQVRLRPNPRRLRP